MTRGSVLAVLGLCAVLTACTDNREPVVGDEPITTEAIAAIMVEHIDLEPLETHPFPALTNRKKSPYAPWPELAEGAVIHFGGLPEGVVVVAGDHVSIRLIVQPPPHTPTPCESCVEDSFGGHDVIISWRDQEPEEDPGFVTLLDRRDGEEVTLVLLGPYITDDPRDLDLGVPLEDLAALVTDPRLSLTTSQEVVDLGDSVELTTP